MSDHMDPVDRVLQSLGGRHWPRATGHAELEKRLMKTFAARSTASFYARHRILISAAGIVALATAGFAAAGGVGLIKSWFMTVTVNGKVVQAGEVVPGEDGQTVIRLPDGALPEGENRVTVTLEGNADEGSGPVTVTVTGGDSGEPSPPESQPDPNAENGRE